MEIFITGDTHGDFRRFRPDIFYEQEHMTKEDLVLVCGDFGGIWHGDPRDDAGLDWLEDRPYTTAFVLGNHENYDTRYDVLILAGDNGVSPMTGPNFRLTDVSFYDMNVTNADSLRGGDNITITAIVGDYNSTADWLELDPVSISVR